MNRVVLPAVGALPVFWDINRCPLPVDCDARRVGPCIERFLSKLGHSGPISITAVGILSKVPKEILEEVSSTGIRLYDLPYGRRSIKSHIRIYWKRNPPPPTPVMLISSPRYFGLFLSNLNEGCEVIFPFPTDSSQADAKILWEKLLLEEDVMCSKTVDPANWVCGVCSNLPGRGFENFLTHLASQEHTLHEQVDEQDEEIEENFHVLFGNNPNKTMVSAKETSTMVTVSTSAKATNCDGEHSFPKTVRTTTGKAICWEHFFTKNVRKATNPLMMLYQ